MEPIAVPDRHSSAVQLETIRHYVVSVSRV